MSQHETESVCIHLDVTREEAQELRDLVGNTDPTRAAVKLYNVLRDAAANPRTRAH